MRLVKTTHPIPITKHSKRLTVLWPETGLVTVMPVIKLATLYSLMSYKTYRGKGTTLLGSLRVLISKGALPPPILICVANQQGKHIKRQPVYTIAQTVNILRCYRRYYRDYTVVGYDHPAMHQMLNNHDVLVSTLKKEAVNTWQMRK